MQYRVAVQSITALTDSVYRLRTDKPQGYVFTPGQYTELAIDRPGFAEETRPFSFTSRPEDAQLEFIFRSHRSHAGVTAELEGVTAGTELVLEPPAGTISYRGPGCFIAGGTGITPFLSIFRSHSGRRDFGANRLLFSNKTEQDRFLTAELQALFDDRVRFVVTHDPTSHCDCTFIDLDYLRPFVESDRLYYVCGPDDMVKEVCTALSALGVGEHNLVLER
ncbi:MAG: flavodoxin reductase [Spirochaetaceae bacterium]|nr:MAG: flavodoxin reductase [Spirochaetaceae bacterium]